MMKSATSMIQSSPCEAVLASVPDGGIEFGYCGVHQTVTRSFVLVNPSSAQTRFNIQTQEQGLFQTNVTQGKSTVKAAIEALHSEFSILEMAGLAQLKRSFAHMIDLCRHARTQAKERDRHFVQD